MAKKDYSSLSADEATRQYGDLLEKEMNIMRDKRAGPLRTLFNSLAFRLPRAADVRSLHDAVLEKNGVAKIEGNVCYNYMPEIIAMVDARGSDAAAKLKTVDKFHSDASALARTLKQPAHEGFLATARNEYDRITAHVKAAKLLP